MYANIEYIHIYVYHYVCACVCVIVHERDEPCEEGGGRSPGV